VRRTAVAGFLSSVSLLGLLHLSCASSWPVNSPIMLGKTLRRTATAVLLSAWSAAAFMKLSPRQLPAEASGVKTITSPTNVTIRYKEPGQAGVCETTPGVNS